MSCQSNLTVKDIHIRKIKEGNGGEAREQETVKETVKETLKVEMKAGRAKVND
jgi:hypothetical protein